MKKFVRIIGIFSIMLLLGLFGVIASQAQYDPCATITDVPTIECEALVALYNSTDGTNWANHTRWYYKISDQNNDTTLCDWLGVTCEANSVTELSLYNKGLIGSLPPELGNLSNLQELLLHNNLLSGTIPLELGSLSNLQWLSLYGTDLSGEIPPELSNLSNLERLNLSDTEISGEIPPELGNLSNLQYLSLSSTGISGEIPPELGNLSNLQSLSLSSTGISGEIPPELGNLSNLTDLYLSDIEISGEIPPELGNLSNLQLLFLSETGISGAIPPELSNLSNLQWLHLFDTGLSGEILLSVLSSDMKYFRIDDTGICEPTNQTYIDWTLSLLSYSSSGISCPMMSISGNIQDDFDARPLEGILVGFADVATGTVTGYTCTAVDGSYVLDSSTTAPPEEEVIVFAAGANEASTVCDDATGGLYHREWFDNIFDLGTATILDLSLSDTATNVDFSLTQTGTPTIPVVTAPIDLIVDTSPDLVWNTVQSASAYDVYLTGPAEYTALLTTVQSDDVCITGVCTYTGTNFAEGLPVGNYALFIRGRNPSSETGAWSASMQFQIAPPTQPFITAPSGSVTENPPTIVWTEGDTAFSYDLYLTGGTYSKIWTVSDTACNGSGSCSTPVPDVLSGGIYAIFVRAENEIGLTAWSPQYSFTIQPDAPLFLSPQGTLTDEFRPDYQWQSLDGVTAYSLYVTGPGTSLFITYDAATVCDTGLCTVNPGDDLNQDLQYGVHATWVQSRVGAAKSDWSNGLVFTVVPGIPQLSAPLSPTADNTPDFVWAVVIGATSYDIYLTGSGVSHLQNYDAATYCDALTCTVNTGLTLSDGVYAAYVLSRNGTTKGEWSSAWFFTVTTAAPLVQSSDSQLDILPSAETSEEAETTEEVTETPLPTEVATETPVPTEIATETPVPTEIATETPVPTEAATETQPPSAEVTEVTDG